MVLKKKEEVETKNNVVEQVGSDSVQETNAKEEAPKQKEKKVRQRLDEGMLVPVISRVKGGLTYKSNRTGMIYRFDKFGDEQVMEVSEIRNMLSSQRSFLQRGWLEIDDEEVVQYLNIEKFQSNVVNDVDIELLLQSKDVDHIAAVIKEAPSNTKRTIFGFAKEQYINEELTNHKIIKAIESALGESLDPNA